MPLPEEVFKYKQFSFSDGGEPRDKLFVVLNQSEINEPCLALKTTSKGRWYIGCVEGCNTNLKCFFVRPVKEACFKKDTFIQMPEIFPFSASELIQGGLSNQIEFIGSLTEQGYYNLRACLKQFSDDIALAHQEMIFKKKKPAK